MAAFVIRRMASMVIVLLTLTAVMFFLQRISPVDPVRVSVGENASREVVEKARQRLGYNEPIVNQYFTYVGDVATGNLQTSLRTKEPVADNIRAYLPASLELIAAAILIATPLALLFGLSGAARWRGSAPFRLTLVGLAAGPSFVLGLLGILLFYKQLGWLPASGQTSYINLPTGPTGWLIVDSVIHGEFSLTINIIQHMIMPAVALALLPAVAVGRVLRGALITNLRADHVRVAESKGLSKWQILIHHCLRNSLSPTLAMSGLMLGLLFAGLTVVEPLFAWPGIGLYLNQSIPRDDFPAIAGVTLLLGIIYVVVNAIIDILQAAADPRITT
jgi:peptide/nickel transport system permease protein